EPRGHADMYGAVLTPPVTPEADYGVIFLTNEGYSSMCGHGVIALTTTLLELGMLPRRGEAETPVAYDSPAGLIRATAAHDGERVSSVRFQNVPSFQYRRELVVRTSVGKIAVDVAWGGAFYALVDSAALGLEVTPEHAVRLTELGMEIKYAVQELDYPVHPAEPGLHGVYGTIITAPPRTSGGDGRNITIYANGAVDRSPCGTGTSARLANMYARGQIGLGEPFRHESVIDTIFTGKVLAETSVAGLPAVETEISGRGFVTGLHQFLLQPDDPVSQGFLVR
ncbi:MAG: proline racemase family protein, partial [Thermomicrobiales bacterium]|nr:proline racemase family protein [Thermomicrobiales bacterium]